MKSKLSMRSFHLKGREDGGGGGQAIVLAKLGFSMFEMF